MLTLKEMTRGRADPLAKLHAREAELSRDTQKYAAEREREQKKAADAQAEATRLFEAGEPDDIQDAAEKAIKHATRAARRADLKCAELRLERDRLATHIKFQKALRAGLAAGEIGANDAELHLKLVPVRASYYDARAEYEGLRQGLPPALRCRLPELPFPMPLVLDASGDSTSPHATAATVNPLAERFAFEIGRITEQLKNNGAPNT